MPPVPTPLLITASSAFPESAATAKDSKSKKYISLASRYHLVPFSVETSRVIGPSAIASITEVGGRIADREDDSRSTSFFLRQFPLTSSEAIVQTSLDQARETIYMNCSKNNCSGHLPSCYLLRSRTLNYIYFHSNKYKHIFTVLTLCNTIERMQYKQNTTIL